MKTEQINGSAGIRNNVSAERLTKTDLTEAVNVDIDRTGKISRRGGRSPLSGLGAAAHSLYAEGPDAFFVSGGSLKRLNADLTATTVRAGVAGRRVAYTPIAGETYWSDGLQSGVIGSAGYRPWGIAVPGAPSLARVPGELRGGTYLAAMTYVRSTGLESGASPLLTITVADYSGLSFSDLPVSDDPLVTHKRLYVSTPGGELPLLAATLSNSDTEAAVLAAPPAGIPLRTSQLGPLPAGQVVGAYNGYSFVASGPYLWYSLSFEYELCHLRDGYIHMGAPVRTFAPVSDGVYVGLESETVFLSGADPAAFESVTVAPYGAVLGTEREVRNDLISKDGVKGTAVMWASTEGICLGLNGGQFTNLTSERYSLAGTPERGASLFKVRNGTPQFLTTLDA
jgi:hypothetical protein